MSFGPFPKKCGCGKVYSKQQWIRLPYAATQFTEDDEHQYATEMRHCSCGTTLAVERILSPTGRILPDPDDLPFHNITPLRPKEKKPVTTYIGMRDEEGGGCKVTVEGRDLPLRLDLRKHSPTGFEWGYGGSGPAQLALALLTHHLKDDEQALGLYQNFKFAIVAAFPKEGWTLTSGDIDRWLALNRQTG